MVDNIVLNAGAGGATLAADDVAGVFYPIQKLAFGALDSVTLASSGAGAVDAGVQRTTLASDDPAVVSLGVMDDWDETNRAAVNIIVGQVGVEGGAGASSALTQRVAIATNANAVTIDAGAVTSLALLDDAVYTDDTSTHATGSSKGYGIMAAAAPTDAAVDVNDIGMVAMTVNRQLKVDASGVAVPVTDGAGSLTVDNNGTFAVQIDAAAVTSLALIDDVVYVDDTATHATGTSKGVLLMAAATPTDAAVDANDIGAVAMTLARQLKVDASGVAVPITDNGGSLTVDAAAGGIIVGDGTNPVVVVTDGADNLANTNNELVTAALTYAFDGTNWDRVTVGGGVEATAMRITIASDSTGVVSVDDNGTTITVDNPTLEALSRAEDTAHTTGHTGVMALAVREAANADLSAGGTDGDYEPLEVDATGRLWTHAGLVDLVTTVSTVTAVTAISTSVTPGTAAANLGKAEDAAHTTGDTGVMALAVREATATDLSAGNSNGDYEPLQVDALGKLWVTGGVIEDIAHAAGEALMGTGARRIDTLANSANASGDWGTVNQTAEGALWATLSPTTLSGLTTFMASGSDGSSILVATKQTIKASAGQLYGYYAYNPEAAATFVHFYNTDTVTVGTTNPQVSFAIPAGAAANLAFPMGVGFSTAISCAATTTAGGNGAPATGVSLVAWYF